MKTIRFDAENGNFLDKDGNVLGTLSSGGGTTRRNALGMALARAADTIEETDRAFAAEYLGNLTPGITDSMNNAWTDVLASLREIRDAVGVA